MVLSYSSDRQKLFFHICRTDPRHPWSWCRAAGCRCRFWSPSPACSLITSAALTAAQCSLVQVGVAVVVTLLLCFTRGGVGLPTTSSSPATSSENFIELLDFYMIYITLFTVLYKFYDLNTLNKSIVNVCPSFNIYNMHHMSRLNLVKIWFS